MGPSTQGASVPGVDLTKGLEMTTVGEPTGFGVLVEVWSPVTERQADDGPFGE